MTIYLVNIALIIFWRVYFTKGRHVASRKIYCWIVATQWILVSGLRDWSVGDDTYAYFLLFENVKKTSWETVFANVFNYLFNDLEIKDPGYPLLTKIFQIFFKDYQIFLITIAVLFMALMARFIYKYSASPCTSFIVFSTLFYEFFAVTGHRQTIATALVVFWGYDLIQRRELLKFLLVSFVAFLIHKSSLVFVPFYFITLIPITPAYMRLCAIGIAITTLLGARIYEPIALWMGVDDHLIYYEGGGAGLFAILLAALSIVTLLFYPTINNHREDADYLGHATILTLFTVLFVFHNQSFMRIQQYYSLFMMLTIPELLNTVKREYRLLAYLMFGAVMVLYLVRKDPYYSFFFMT